MGEHKEHSRRGILANSALNIGGQFAVGAAGALGALITAHVLGAEALGILGVTFILADLGRPLSSFTHVPSIMEVHRDEDPDVVFATSLAIKLGLSALFSVLILALSPLLVNAFHLPPMTVFLASAVVLVGSFYEVGSARLEAENRMTRSNLILGAGSLVGLLIILALWLSGLLTIYTSILATVLANVAMSIGAILFVRWPFRARIDVKIGKRLLSYGVRILATALLTQGLLQSETLLVSAFLDNHQAGVYTVVLSLALVMVTAANAVSVAVLPALSRSHGKGEDTSRGYQHGTLIALGIGIALGVFFILAGPWILSLYGPDFAEGYVPLVILTLFGVFASAVVPATSMLNVHGHAGTQTKISLVLLVAHVILSIVLLRSFGLVGAAVATTIVFAAGTLATWSKVKEFTGAWPFPLT